MSSAIANYGIPFMRSVVDLAALRRLLHGPVELGHHLAYRRPAAALLAGDAVQARALMEAELEAIGTRTDLAAADFRRFAHSLRDRLPPQSSR